MAPPIAQNDVIAPVAEAVTQARDADVFFFAGGVERHFVARFLQCVLSNRQRPNALLLLTTFGGSGDAAYQMARGLQESCEGGRVAVQVTTFCKSAGTLLALGANEIVMGDFAELGPLDVQITKPDTLGERLSGLTPSQSLSTLRTEAFLCFEKFFLDILRASDYAITTRTAANIAAQVTAGLYRPVYAQVDPMRLGEFQRAVQIAMEYGKRLDAWAKNLKERALSRLITGYPSHDFVIDRREAATLFNVVKAPSAQEDELAASLVEDAVRSAGGNNADIRYLSPKPVGPENGSGTPRPAPRAGRRPPRAGASPPRDGDGGGGRTPG